MHVSRLVEVPVISLLFLRHLNGLQLACLQKLIRQRLQRKIVSRKRGDKIRVCLNRINCGERFSKVANHRQNTAPWLNLVAKKTQVSCVHQRHIDCESEQMIASDSSQCRGQPTE